MALCDELFQYVLNINRSSKLDASAHPAYETVRRNVRDIIGRIRTEAATDADLNRAFRMVEKSLYYFVDSMFADCERWEPSLRWSGDPLQREEFGEGTGDKEFWVVFDEILGEARSGGEPQMQALEVMYAMVGLGFTGIHVNDHEFLQSKMSEAWNRLQSRYSFRVSRLCPSAYENVNDANLEPDAGMSLLRTGVVLVIGFVAILFATRAVFNQAEAEFTSVIGAINDGRPVQTVTQPGEVTP
ncbi:MAG: DotU family type IV/VI secretion system protein [Phycisphaerales bacterium]|nr:DotU family type IV/VI secretion system protein [Phycisphaerales bacterium]